VSEGKTAPPNGTMQAGPNDGEGRLRRTALRRSRATFAEPHCFMQSKETGRRNARNESVLDDLNPGSVALEFKYASNWLDSLYRPER
jgi:hypothetical protein